MRSNPAEIERSANVKDAIGFAVLIVLTVCCALLSECEHAYVQKKAEAHLQQTDAR